jgi:hypothetical protein
MSNSPLATDRHTNVLQVLVDTKEPPPFSHAGFSYLPLRCQYFISNVTSCFYGKKIQNCLP